MLAAAGYKNGLTLTDLYLNDSVNTALFQAVQASFANCGIKLNGKAEPISSFFVDLGNAPQNNKANEWDVAQPAWIPDWFGDNGRTTVQPFFQTDCAVNTINYGCFSSKTLDADIAKALKAPNATAAAPLWHEVDMIAMQNAVIVPLVDQYNPTIYSSRVASPGSSVPCGRRTSATPTSPTSTSRRLTSNSRIVPSPAGYALHIRPGSRTMSHPQGYATGGSAIARDRGTVRARRHALL